MVLWSSKTLFINQSTSPDCLSVICQAPCWVIQREQRKPFIEELLTLGQLQPLPRDPPWQQRLAHEPERTLITFCWWGLFTCLPPEQGGAPPGQGLCLLPTVSPGPQDTLTDKPCTEGQEVDSSAASEALSTWLPIQETVDNSLEGMRNSPVTCSPPSREAWL